MPEGREGEATAAASFSFLLLFLALAFIEVGGGLFQVVLYGLLAGMRAPGLLFGVGYALTTVPALIGPVMGHAFARRHGGFRPLLVIGGLNLAMLAWVAAEGEEKVLTPLLALDLTTSLFGAFAGPIFQSTIRAKISGENLIRNVIRLDVLVLSSGAVLGLGLGSVFFETLGYRAYIYMIFFGYAISLGVLAFAGRRDPELFSYGGAAGAISLGEAVTELRRSATKRSAALIMPAAALVGVPLMTMLPALTLRLDLSVAHLLGTVPLSVPTFMLFGRSLGQIIGPLVTTRRMIDGLSRSRFAPPILLTAFIACYAAGLGSGKLELAFPLVVAAHLATNILWTYSFFLMQTSFSEGEIGAVFALQNQLTMMIYLVDSLLSGVLLDVAGPIGIFALSTTSMIVPIFLATVRR